MPTSSAIVRRCPGEAGHPLDADTAADTTIAQRRIDGGKTTGSKQPGKSLLDCALFRSASFASSSIICTPITWSCHRGDRIAEPGERKAEQGSADPGDGEELRPHTVETCGAIKDRLGQHDKMCVGCGQHEILHGLRHAVARRCATGKHL